jgi:hypothetical protein
VGWGGGESAEGAQTNKRALKPKGPDRGTGAPVGTQ